MAGTFTGGVTLTGLKAGETTLELKAGEITRTIPVLVMPSLIPLIPDFTEGDVSMTSVPGKPGTYRMHADPAATHWYQSGDSAPFHLDAGTYLLEGAPQGVGWQWNVRVSQAGGGRQLQPAGERPRPQVHRHREERGRLRGTPLHQQSQGGRGIHAHPHQNRLATEENMNWMT